MKRVQLLPTQGLAHVSRTVALAAALAPDHVVSTVLSAPFLPLAELAGVPAQVVDVPPLDYDRFSRGDPQWDSADDLEAVASAYGRAIDDFGPDAVVTSMPLAASIPIRARGLPHVTLFDACNHPQFRVPDPPGQASERSERAAKVLELMGVVGARLGAPPESSSRALFVADLNLMPDVPSLFPIRDLPRSFAYVGPLALPTVGPVRDPGLRIDPDEPLVYVSMGSSGRPEHMRTLARQLHGTSYQVVITTGGVLPARELAAFERPGFHVRDFVPGEAVMAASRRTVVICHGGMGTVYQALGQRVHALLVVPAHRQHVRIGMRLAELGLGRLLGADDLTDVPVAVAECFAAPAAGQRDAIAADLRTYPGAPLARDLVTTFVAGR